MTAFTELAEVIAIEERAAFANALADRIHAIKDLPDGPIRGRIYAAAALIGGAELMQHLEGTEAAARQLRALADRLERRRLN
jgi:hypothetical protein